jgi:preprotein translocase subunit SecB
MSKKNTEISLDDVAKLVASLKLGQIRLLEAHGKLGNIQGGKLPGNARQEMNLQTALDQKKKAIQVIATYCLSATYESAETIDENAPIFVRGRFVLQYEYVGAGDVKSLIKAMQPTAVMNSWPFWRELVHSLTVRMGIPPFPVPLVNLSELVTTSEHKTRKMPRKSRAKIG